MKRLASVAIAAMALGSAPLSAQTLGDHFEGAEFKNRGQCQAALVQERNNRRVNDGNTGSYSDPEYNRVVHAKYECVEATPGVWVVQIDGDWTED